MKTFTATTIVRKSPTSLYAIRSAGRNLKEPTARKTKFVSPSEVENLTFCTEAHRLAGEVHVPAGKAAKHGNKSHAAYAKKARREARWGWLRKVGVGVGIALLMLILAYAFGGQ